MKSVLLLGVACALLALGGCGGAAMYAEDYDQSCTLDDDCAQVYEGDPCDCGTEAAVNTSEADAYNEAWREAQEACFFQRDCATVHGAPQVAYCDNGTCDVKDRY